MLAGRASRPGGPGPSVTQVVVLLAPVLAPVWAAQAGGRAALAPDCGGSCANGGLCLPRLDDPSQYGCFCAPGYAGPNCAKAQAGPEIAPASGLDEVAPAPKPAGSATGLVVTAQTQSEQPGFLAPSEVAKAPAWAQSILQREDTVDTMIKQLESTIQQAQGGPLGPAAVPASAISVVAQAPATAATQSNAMLTGTAMTGGVAATSSVPLPYVKGSFFMQPSATHPVDSASFPEFFRLAVWHSLADVHVTKEDIAVTNVVASSRRIDFTVTPTHAESDVDEIATKLKQEVANDASDLRDLLPQLDPATAVVSVHGLPASPHSAPAQVPANTPLASPAETTAQGTYAGPGAAAAAPAAAAPAAPGAAPQFGKPGKKGMADKFKKAKEGPIVPISVTLECIIILTVQFFAIYTLLQVCKWFDQTKEPFKFISETVDSAKASVDFAPMCAVLFLGTRMRALQLGIEPQDWVKEAMQITTWSILGTAILALVEHVLAGKIPALAAVFSIGKYVAVIGLTYGSCTVVYGVMNMEPNKELYPNGPPPVAPAMQATIYLTVQFFIVAIGHLVLKTLTGYIQSDFIKGWEKCLDMCKETVKYAPMLAVLFIGTRMRALQIDPKASPESGVPQPWAQTCFLVCMWAVLVQTILVLLKKIIGGGKVVTVEKKEPDGTITTTEEYQVDNPTMGTVFNMAQMACMLGMYGCAVAIVYAVHTMKDKRGGKPTPPIAPSLENVILLTTQFFLIYALQYLFITLKDMKRFGDFKIAIKVLTDARDTVFFAPMLGILFMGARMRAEEITDGAGSPQGWVIEGMFASTYALATNCALILVQAILPRDQKGQVAPPIIWLIIKLVEEVARIALYAGVVIVIVGIMVMEPMTLDGKGGYIYYVLLSEGPGVLHA